MKRLVLATVVGLALAGCLPIPQVVPERLTPRYLGPEPVSVNMNCANTNEFMWIEGPHSVGLRISPRYFPERRLGVLQMRLVALLGRPAMLEPQTLAVVAGGGTSARSVAVVSDMSAPGKTYDFEVRIEDLPGGPVRVGLPRIRIGEEVWRPADLELVPAGATLRPMPFNC